MKVVHGTSYIRMTDLVGSFRMRYLPSSQVMIRSTMDRRIPNMLLRFISMVSANVSTWYVWTPKIEWFHGSVGVCRDTYPNFMVVHPAKIACAVHRPSLKLLFFNSVAKHAPRCASKRWRHELLVPGSYSLSAFTNANSSVPGILQLTSVRQMIEIGACSCSVSAFGFPGRVNFL